MGERKEKGGKRETGKVEWFGGGGGGGALYASSVIRNLILSAKDVNVS